MRRRLLQKRSARWWTLSIIAHAALIFVLAQIVFRYPLGQVMGYERQRSVPERIQYIVVPAPATESSGATKTDASPSAAPAELRAPTNVPAAVPPPQTDTARSQAAGGTGDGGAGDGRGFARGVAPAQPDPRIELTPDAIPRAPRTVAEDVDSIVALAIGIYSDSMAAIARQRKPEDWTIKRPNGDVWGMDPQFIHLGKFKIPTALLALLPLNTQSRISPIEQRSLAYIRRDVTENAQRSISEDEFRAAVKRIRERKERERREKAIASRTDP